MESDFTMFCNKHEKKLSVQGSGAPKQMYEFVVVHQNLVVSRYEWNLDGMLNSKLPDLQDSCYWRTESGLMIWVA